MKVFICECKYTYVIGRKNVYGPLWEDRISTSLGILMTRKQWKEQYPDCVYNYRRHKKMTELWTWDQAYSVADYFSNQDASIREDISMQILKLQEEVGEVAQAFIGWTGQNTRKGVTHTTDDIVAELVDVAITAMVGIATMSMLDGPQDDTFEYARSAANRVWERFQEHSGVSMSGMPGVSDVVSDSVNESQDTRE